MKLLRSLVCATAFAVSAVAQTTPTVRTETQLVEVDTIATNSHGHPVMDLRADELRMFEDGHLRPLTHFSMEHLEKPNPESTRKLRELALHKSSTALANFTQETTP